MVISDGGSYFIEQKFLALLRSYGVNHRIAIAYLPQMNGQVEVSNQKIKNILEKTVSRSRTNWPTKLDDTL